MRHLCIKDYYSVNYDLSIKKGHIYTAYSCSYGCLKIHYCHGGTKRLYEYAITLLEEIANKRLVPLDEHSEEQLFEMALKHGVIVEDSLISFLDMINTDE